jgi:hypothetical protein
MKFFKDLFKRGSLPDDERVVPNWLKIKNEQFVEVFEKFKQEDIPNNA